MLNAERQQQVLEFIRQQKRATVTELSAHFDVSEATIRRDLEMLHSMGVIRRAHGGAIAMEREGQQAPVVLRPNENEDDKKRIGAAAANLIRDGETVFIGSGTTTIEVARRVHDKKDLTVITNALNVANELAENNRITLIITGGLFRHSELSMIGHLTEQALKELRADKVFLGMKAINIEDGLTNDYLPETMTDRRIVQFAPEIILVADHSKFGKLSTSLVSPVTAAHRIVTDDAAPAEIVAALRALGVDVIIA